MKARLLLLLVLLICLLTFSSKSYAQRTDFQSWTQVTGTFSLDDNKKWFAYMEAQPRVGHDVQGLERLLIRPAVGYNVDQHVSLWLGYAWTPTFMNSNYDADFRNENRIWQQVLIKHSMWGLDWQHRIRQEQRIIEDASATSNRTRYLLRGSYPLPCFENLGLTGYNELFVNENGAHRGPRGGFDRDRVFFGPYIKSGPGRYEVGYLGEYTQQFGKDSRMINALLVSANFNF